MCKRMAVGTHCTTAAAITYIPGKVEHIGTDHHVERPSQLTTRPVDPALPRQRLHPAKHRNLDPSPRGLGRIEPRHRQRVRDRVCQDHPARAQLGTSQPEQTKPAAELTHCRARQLYDRPTHSNFWRRSQPAGRCHLANADHADSIFKTVCAHPLPIAD